MISEMLSHEKRSCSTLSMDVFDTAITRACGSPEALFLMLGNLLSNKGLLDCSPEEFARARIRADKFVWKREGGLDSKTQTIHFNREVVRWLNMPDNLAEKITEEELDLESKLLRGIPRSLDYVNHAIKIGYDIVFISDTYFSQKFVQERLKTNQIWVSGAKIFCSSDEGLSKASGKLFQSTLAKLGRQPSKVLHIGDNPHSDVRIPKKLGFKVAWYPEGRLNRYEQILCKNMWATSGLSAAFAGASRLARLSITTDDSKEIALRDVAAGVAAPILVSYVLWLLRRAKEMGIGKLCFLARDGQILAQIAQKLAQKLGVSVDIIYLHVSRKVTNLAATFEMNDEELGWVFRDIPSLTYGKFFARFGLIWNEISSQLPNKYAENKAVDPTEAPRLKKILTDSPIREKVLEIAKARRKIVTKYLDEQGILGKSKIGVIDFGGMGSQIRAMHTLISSTGSPDPKLFLIGIDTTESLECDGVLSFTNDSNWLKDTECYLYDHRRNRGIKRERGFGTCVQMFCAADHGTVTRIEESGDIIVPVHSPETDTKILVWGLPMVRKTLNAFVENLVLDQRLVNPDADLREASCEVIDAFWREPSRSEARAWGAYPMEGGQVESNQTNSLARKYSWLSVVQDLARRKFPNLGWQHWFEGSLAQSPWLLRNVVLFAEKQLRPNAMKPRSGLGEVMRDFVRRLLGK